MVKYLEVLEWNVWIIVAVLEVEAKEGAIDEVFNVRKVKTTKPHTGR